MIDLLVGYCDFFLFIKDTATEQLLDLGDAFIYEQVTGVHTCLTVIPETYSLYFALYTNIIFYFLNFGADCSNRTNFQCSSDTCYDHIS